MISSVGTDFPAPANRKTVCSNANASDDDAAAAAATVALLMRKRRTRNGVMKHKQKKNETEQRT